MENPETAIAVVTTTVGSMDDATQLARRVVERRLGACVQIDAIASSVYTWEQKVCAEPEFRLTIKTVPAGVGKLEAFFAESHPYDVPQFVVVPATASKAYAKWVAEATAIAS